jgi:hypothetical protein
MDLVFEFKKLITRSDSRSRYIHHGVQNFVSGIYSERQPVAVMVGILLASREEAIQGLCLALAHRPTAAAIHACADTDHRFVMAPSTLFPKYATFDTEHLRSASKAPSHGTIRIAHLFLEFPYAKFTCKRKQRAALIESLENDDDV